MVEPMQNRNSPIWNTEHHDSNRWAFDDSHDTNFACLFCLPSDILNLSRDTFRARKVSNNLWYFSVRKSISILMIFAHSVFLKITFNGLHVPSNPGVNSMSVVYGSDEIGRTDKAICVFLFLILNFQRGKK